MSVYGLGPILSPAAPAAPVAPAGPGHGSSRRDEDSPDPAFSAMLATLVGPRTAAPPTQPSGDKAPSADETPAGGSADGAAAGGIKTGNAKPGSSAAAAAALLAALGATGAGTGPDAIDGAAFLARLQAGLPVDAKGELGLEQLQALLASYGDEMPAELLALNGQADPAAPVALAPNETVSVATELMALLKAGAVTKAGSAGTAEAVTAAVQAAPAAVAADAAKAAAGAPPTPTPGAHAAADPGKADSPEGGPALTAATPALAQDPAQATRVAQAGETPGGQARAREDRNGDNDTGFDPVAQAANLAGGAQPAGSTAAAHEVRFLERIPNPVDPSRLIESLPKALAETGPGQYSMTLQLHPADLGSVRLQLHLTGNQVHAVMEVASPAARDALQSQSEQLRQGLTQSGLTLTGFEVSTGHSGSSPRDRQEQFAEPTGPERVSTRSRPQAAPRPAEPAERPQPRRPGSRIDTLV